MEVHFSTQSLKMDFLFSVPPLDTALILRGPFSAVVLILLIQDSGLGVRLFMPRLEAGLNLQVPYLDQHPFSIMRYLMTI